MHRGDLGGGGGGGGGGRSLLEFEPLPTQRVPLCLIFQYPFLAMDPKNFLKEPSAPIYTNFWGGARAEKTRATFFSQKFWPKQGQNSALGELENSICST